MNWQYQQLETLSAQRQADALRSAEHDRLVRLARAYRASTASDSPSTTSAPRPAGPLAPAGATHARLARQVTCAAHLTPQTRRPHVRHRESARTRC